MTAASKKTTGKKAAKRKARTSPRASRSSGLGIDTESALSLYRVMLKIRRTEEQLARSYQAGLIPGACHTYIGEEAIATGVCAHLQDTDAVFSTHRGHGHALAKGVPIREVIAELYGKATGCSQGRGGSMHLFKPEVGMMGTSGIVAPCILQATGAGYSFKLLGTDRVGVAFFGDGAVSNGAFHEGLTMAARWQLPALFICENNLYATEVAFSTATQNPEVANRGEAYAIESVAVDGNDVLAMHAAAGEAVRRARSGGGPTLIECKTYRTRAHAEGMRDGGYRTQKEIDSWKAKDPIAGLHKRLVSGKIASKEELEAIDSELKAEVRDGLKFAEESPWPDPATVLDHVYSRDGARA